MREGWKEVLLGEIISIKHGYGFKGEFFVDAPNKNLLLTPGNFAIGGGFKSDKMKYYEGPISSDFVLSAGDVIVTMTDLSKQADTLGFSARIPKDPKKIYLHNQRIGLVSLKNDECDLNFIYWLLRTHSYQRYIAGSSSGATVKHTSPTKIYSAKVNFPKSKETQRKIASILSGYDDLIENNLKRIKLLEEKAQLTYEEWFIKMRFPGYETATFDEVTGLPEGWEKVKLEVALKANNGKSFKGIYTSDDHYPVYGSNGIIGYSQINNNEEAIIIGRVGAYCGAIKYCKGKFWATDNTIAVTSISAKMSNLLAYYILDKLNLRNMAGGSAQPLLTQRLINNLEIITPSESIAYRFQKSTLIVFNSILNLQTQNRLLKEARDILLPRLMSGMVDVEELAGQIVEEMEIGMNKR